MSVTPNATRIASRNLKLMRVHKICVFTYRVYILCIYTLVIFDCHRLSNLVDKKS